MFENGEEHQFDAIIFATGYKNHATKWLKVLVITNYQFVLFAF